MCGINGIAGISDTSKAAEIIGRMNDALSHRGPDDQGIFTGGSTALGHRRLAIIDLSSNGHQPMFSNDGNLVLVFNGEIYNYRDIRKQLPDHQFKTNSDSEVLLAAYQQWGKDCLDKLDGMFAFLIFDQRSNKLFGARDRMGVKPLYWSQQHDVFLFSSELRAILKSGMVKAVLNRDKLPEFLQYQTVFAPHTIIRDVHMLMPGTWFEIMDGAMTTGCYWNPDDKAAIKATDISYNEAALQVKKLFYQAVEKRLVSDVPFGAFLSGGIDSSAVVAAMSTVSSEVNTFNVNFAEEAFSESVFARQVAERYRTHHHEINLSPGEFLALVPDALAAMDHPSGDGPNTYVVSKATKQAGITMALSGIGGDEWFGGYPVFHQMAGLGKYKWLNAVPLGLRKLAANILVKNNSGAALKQKAMLTARHIDEQEAYRISRQLFTDTLWQRILKYEGDYGKTQVFKMFDDRLVSSISVAECKTYLQHTLLRDTDQMSMAHALEVREPFLDHHLAEFVLTLPDSYKQYPKKLLTDAMGDALPYEVVHRKKMGFVLPWEVWMRKDLRPFLVTQWEQIRDSGIYDNNYLDDLFNRFFEGDNSVSWPVIWNLSVLSYWMSHNHVEY